MLRRLGRGGGFLAAGASILIDEIGNADDTPASLYDAWSTGSSISLPLDEGDAHEFEIFLRAITDPK